MHILVIGRSFPEVDTGMMGIFEFEQACALKNVCHQISYAFCDTRSLKDLKTIKKIRLMRNQIECDGIHLPIGGIPYKIQSKIKFAALKNSIIRLINKNGKPSVIHIHFPLLSINEEIFRYLKQYNVPIIITEHWTKVQNKTIKKQYLKLLKLFTAEVDEFICVSQNLRRSILELTGKPRKILVIPNIVSQEFNYTPIHESKEFYFITIGRLVKVKRFDLLIKAFNHAFRTKSHIKLIIVGDGPEFSVLDKLIIELNLNEQIKLKGFQPRQKTAELLMNSHVFVSASILETFGVPFVEAMVCGKPVIGASNSPIKEYITEETGLLFSPDNLEALSDALNTINQNYDKYDSRLIADIAESNFSEAAIIKQLTRLYDELIKSKGRV